MTHSMTMKLFIYFVVTVLVPPSTAFGPASSIRPLLKSLEQTHRRKSLSLTKTSMSVSYETDKISDCESKEETSQLPVEYGNRALLNHVVLRSEIPQGYKKFTVDLNHPEEWIPTKRHTEEESAKLKEELHAWFESTGVFALPGMECRFEHCDVGNFGGPARIVPGTNYEGSKIVHKFWTAFALWDDVLDAGENSLDEGKQSISKIRELFQKTGLSSSHDGKEDSADETFVSMFDRINKEVFSLPYYDGLTEEERRNYNARYVSSMIKWLNDFETELEQSFNVEACMPFDDAWDLRAGTISFNVSNVMLEAAAEASFPDHMYMNEKVQRMLYLISYLPGISNELASLPKDLADLDVHPRLTCTMEEKGLDSYADLCLLLASMYKEGIQEFDSLYKELLADGCLDDEESTKYVSHLRQYVMGATHWFVNAERYAKWVLVDHDEQYYFDFACAE